MGEGITSVQGIRVGHAADYEAVTGCTVLLCEEGAVAGVDVRGFAAGTCEMEALAPGHVVDCIHGLCLAGGSAYGLAAAAGVVQFLEERGVGFRAGGFRIPIVPAAILFDLHIGDGRIRPGPAMAYRACEAATRGRLEEGSVGVGTGATVGKLFGIKRAMKGGVGTVAVRLSGGLVVAALAAVNAFGDIRDPKDDHIIAGVRDRRTGRQLADTVAQMRRGRLRGAFGQENTTLAVIGTNAILDKVQAAQVARMGQDGLARTIAPVHTLFDGDVVFALATGRISADVNLVGTMGAEVIAQAITRGVTMAQGLGGVPATWDLAR